MAGNHQVFVRLDDIGGDPALGRADAGPVLAVGCLVEFQPQPAARLGYGAADWCCILPYAGGEDDAVEAAKRRRKRADLAGSAVVKHLERKSCPWLLARQQLAK